MGDGDGCPGDTHPPPLRKVTSQSSSLGLPLTDGCPQGIGGGLLGCIQLMECNLLAEILHGLMQFVVSEVAKLCLEVIQSSPLGWGLSVGEWGSPSPSEGGKWGFEGSPPTAIIYTLTWVSEGAIALTAMALSGNSVTLMAPQVVCCMSSVEQNRATNSVT